ncbi:reversion-inducing cysteine-rich protein with Kazal motifs [Phymastichus coffea]|uniref:reversion-inducing cysteine-rich protein with Kazal motifs n=1 Tax=Phymastichus coffea TaxID=108790 RepID=UPI00273AFD09|nr:reversion-inducing cysteine-rich protein with Kazal motifs [Phymastichus coffea]
MGRVPTVLVAVLAVMGLTGSEEMSCCSRAAGSCRSFCSKLSLVKLGEDPYARDNATRTLAELCSTELVEFWDCVNATFSDVERNENWSGRPCCRKARNPLCQAACATAGARHELRRSCRWSDEPELADCLDQREDADECCSSVANSTCRSICREVIHKPAKQSVLKVYSSRGCFHQVPKCLKGSAEVKPSEDPKLYTHCCEQAASADCQESCRRLLHASSSILDVFGDLEASCGAIKPHAPLWSCLFKSSPSRPQRVPANIGKLTCCEKAQRAKCKELCTKAFQTDWSAWQQLDGQCLASPLENDLRRCLEDTEDSCEMGCSGLSFCSKFNDRPTTLFRTCNAAADESAKWEADHWLRGGIIAGLGVPVRAAPSCPADVLRAAACLLQLRPCEPRVHETRLCREDCMELMTSCVDWSAVKGHNAATLCAKLSPAKADAPCVSLKPFLEDPREQNELPVALEEDISTPCRSSPCSQGQICVVHPDQRQNYRCLPGCNLGEMSKQLIPVGAWTQIPRSDSKNQVSHRICQCSASGKLDKCRDLFGMTSNSCWVQSSVVPHRATFYMQCNQCRCFAGEITCSRKSCAEIRLPSIPCDCSYQYVPVCGMGATYASKCLAGCSKLTGNDVEYNSCSSKDPCRSNPCAEGETCVRRPRVCLAHIHKPCEQFECVPKKCDRRADLKGPVCDTGNRQHASLCSLLRAGATLAYRGACLRGCSLRGPVCAINGNTYSSECAAWAERTIVDYSGQCVAFGLVSEVPKPRCGDAVVCPPPARPNCLGVTPPGACCPVCAGAARLQFSKKQLERIYSKLPEDSDKHSLTLEAMLSGLSRQLQVAECVLRGSMTPEGDIFIANQAVSRRPSDLQLSACVAEIEKLVSRISERSPRIVVEVPMSSLLHADILHARLLNSLAMKVETNAFILTTVIVASFIS